MGTGQRRSALSYIPGYKNNAVLQLIIFSASAYIMLAICWALIMIVYVGDNSAFLEYFVPNISLGQVAVFKSHWWTIATYGWFQTPNSFMELLSSMLWLYCFGSVVQMLVGHRQVIPLYTYCLLVGGAAYMLGQLLPGKLGLVFPSFLGARAGLMGMAVAAITLTPNYRFYLTETFSIPLMVVAGIFTILMIVGSGFNLPILFMLMAGGGMGYLYVRLLKAGYRPGDWAYSLAAKTENLVTPVQERQGYGRQIPLRPGNGSRSYSPKQGISQRLIDDILDKINQKGYNALSKEEKEILLQAGRE